MVAALSVVSAGLGVLVYLGIRPDCPPSEVKLELPRGFCSKVFAKSLGAVRHLTVAGNGDVFAAVGGGIESYPRGALVILRDRNRDGIADTVFQYATDAGNDVEMWGGSIFFSTNTEILRFPYTPDDFPGIGVPDTIVSGLPADGTHPAKSLAFGPREMFVSIGSVSNTCSGGRAADPCPELASRAGIWRFGPDVPFQRFGDGVRYATGLRHTVALAFNSADQHLYGVIHGRDHLKEAFAEPAQYARDYDDANPGEEFVRIEEGDDFGWPYCFYSVFEMRKVLAPEYGGDGRKQGQCLMASSPLLAFPAHWAPNDLLFHSGRNLPDDYRRGAFVAFHGSMYRREAEGYNVVFVPRAGHAFLSEWEVFADGFAGPEKHHALAKHRPVGLAEGVNGEIFVSDDWGGRIFMIYRR